MARDKFTIMADDLKWPWDKDEKLVSEEEQISSKAAKKRQEPTEQERVS